MVYVYRGYCAPECDYDGEPPDYDFQVLSSSEHTARKIHSCDDCNGAIQKGQRYKKVVARDEGQFVVLKSHMDGAECAKARIDQLEWDHQQSEIMGDWYSEQYVQEYSILCTRCQGLGAEHECYDDWENCRACGGAGRWDTGQVYPEAFQVEGTEPRIPADLTNIYRPTPRKVRTPEPSAHVYGPDETPF